MANNKEAFAIFDEWLKVRGHKKGCNKKILWKDFVAEVKQCGIINVFNCSDYNKLKQLLGLSYTDDEGWCINGPIKYKQFKIGDKNE